MNIFYVTVDDVPLKVITIEDEFGIDIEAVYVGDSRHDISHILNDNMMKTIENEVLKELEEMSEHLRSEM